MHEPEEVFHPWGTVSPAFWGAPALASAEQAGPGTRTPEALRERLAAIAATASEGRLQDAAWMAYELDTEIAAEHMNVVHIREVRGHLAHLVGDHATTLGWYLHTASLRATVQGPRYPDTEEATRRVHSLWRTVPARDAHRLGIELLGTVTDIHGPDAPVALRTRRRLESLARNN
ncbi:hypothetical protein ACFU98_38410 [Streptomyces sp. NPDC057575]|uniref:hypothetical protein n=1 Tax=unclassified Streptomyces TaxID=2593676 RepID=UPI0036BC133B